MRACNGLLACLLPADRGGPMTEPADDLPAESWLHVRVLDSDTPRAVRLRHWLKEGLRRHGIKCVRITGSVPDDVRVVETQREETERDR